MAPVITGIHTYLQQCSHSESASEVPALRLASKAVTFPHPTYPPLPLHSQEGMKGSLPPSYCSFPLPTPTNSYSSYRALHYQPLF